MLDLFTLGSFYIDIHQKNGDKFNSQNIAKTNIQNAKAGIERLHGKSLRVGDSALENEMNIHRKLYAMEVKDKGEASIEAMSAGKNVAGILKRTQRSIEAIRLLTNVSKASHRVHGANHESTQDIDKFLAQLKAEQVVGLGIRARLMHGLQPSDSLFLAIKYDDSGEKCFVQGPFKQPRDEMNEQTLLIECRDLVLGPGLIVLCDGLQNASHLNGIMGEIRSYNSELNRYCVYFEDDMIGPVQVKPENLKIVFDFPGEG